MFFPEFRSSEILLLETITRAGMSIIITGPSGIGKTELAKYVISKLNLRAVYYPLPPNKIRISKFRKPEIVIVDEAHLIRNFELYFELLNQAQFVFITNRPGYLPDAFLNRAVKIEIQELSDEEKSKIFEIISGKNETEILSVTKNLREIVNLARIIKTTGQELVEILNLLGYEKVGDVWLSPMEKRYYEIVKNSGPVSSRVLRARLQVDEKTLEMIEKKMFEFDLVEITTRGRILKGHCPACNRIVEKSWQFCPHCKEKLKQDTDGQETV